MATNVMFMVLDGTGSICITAIASNIMQYVVYIVVTSVSHMLSSLCMKSDFTHAISEPSSLKMLKVPVHSQKTILFPAVPFLKI